jgi:hypothetical protein
LTVCVAVGFGYQELRLGLWSCTSCETQCLRRLTSRLCELYVLRQHILSERLRHAIPVQVRLWEDSLRAMALRDETMRRVTDVQQKMEERLKEYEVSDKGVRCEAETAREKYQELSLELQRGIKVCRYRMRVWPSSYICCVLTCKF